MTLTHAPGCPRCDRPGAMTPGCGRHPIPFGYFTLRGEALLVFTYACKDVARTLPRLPWGEQPKAWYVGGKPVNGGRGERRVNMLCWPTLRNFYQLWRIAIPEPVIRERAA